MKAEKAFLVVSVLVLVDAVAEGEKTFLANASMSIPNVRRLTVTHRSEKSKFKECKRSNNKAKR